MNMNMRFRELFTGDRRRSGNTNVNVILLVSITFAIGTSTSGSTTPTECSDPHQNPYGGFCYLARLKEKHTWNGAVDQCRQQDMELASVHSMSEGDFIHGLVTSRTKWEGVWIGMRRDGNGEFRWLDGTSTSIFNWADKEPNSNKTGSTYNEECVEMYKSNGKWNDLPCVRILGYVCKALKRTTVRLVGGSSLSEGRVEIQRNGAFGTVCDDYWGHNDAAVICRMLGYIGGKALVKSHYGRGTGSIWLDNVACKGDEDDVFLCKHRGWGIEDCDHTEDAGVSCYARTTVRLVGGSRISEGRVEIQRNGAFGTVCDDYWDDNDAAVICRMMGYSGGKALVESHYGRGTGSIWLDNVACKGDEDDVFICKHRGWGIEDCDHTEDAGVSCYARTTVRLVGGSSLSEGRVEIQRNGAFGTVCDDYWDDNDAAVICRMMGYSGGKALVESHYGRGTGSIWLDDVACKGDEDDVFLCHHRGWGIEDCDHTEDAGVSCQASTMPQSTTTRFDQTEESTDTTIDFMGKSSTTASVQRSTTPTECSDPSQNPYGGFCYLARLKEKHTWHGAVDQCRQQDMELASVHSMSEGDFIHGLVSSRTKWEGVWIGMRRDGNGEFQWLDGTSTSIFNWADKEPNSNKTGSTYNEECVEMYKSNGKWNDLPCVRILGYVCKALKRTTVRLVGGSSLSEGRVEIQRNGAFGTVCDNDWDDNDAAVICRMMGYIGGKALVKSHYGRGTGSIWLDNVACKGDEDDVFLCKHRGWGIEDCDHTEDAGVSCYARTTVQLVGGSSLSEGRVEIQRNGAFGTVCDDDWDDNDAAVICRMMGYSGGKALVESHYGRGTGSIWLDNVACKGDEDDVFLCKHRGWGIEDCDHTEDAGVSCYARTTVRLVGGSSLSEGRVEIQRNGAFGTVCDDYWDDNDAAVICRMMGYSGGKALVESHYGRGTGSIWLDDVACKGDEDDVFLCHHRGWGIEDCDHTEDAGVSCQASTMPQSTTTRFDQTEESTDTTIDFMGKSSTTASVQMPQNTTTRFNQTEESTDTTIDFMGKSSTTASVQIFDTGMTCSQLQMDESGSNVIWNCRLIGVFPKTICQVEYSKHQISNSALLPLNDYSTHTAFATKPDFVDSVCTLEMPAELLDAGTYTFIMSMQPDVFDGSRHVQSVQSDFILVKHNVEGRCTLDTLWIIGGTGAALLIFLFICSVIGFCLGKRHGEGEYSTKADNHTGTDRGINLEGLNMDTPSNSDEHPDQTTRYRPMAFNKTPTPRMSLKEKQQSKQQKPKKQQESGNDIADVYVNQSDPRSKSASQNHDYHHSKSNKCLNTAVFKQQEESNNVFPEKAMLPRNYTEKQQQRNAAFDPSEEDLEPAETRNILSGTGRPFDGVTAARWDEGPSGNDDENIYEEIFPNQAIDCDTCNDNFFLEPDQGKAIPVSNDTEIAMENMYMSI